MKTIVITGSTRGIGFGLATFFLKNGCQVVINGTSEKSVNRALENLEPYATGSKVIGVAGDVSLFDTHEKIIEKAMTTFKKIDIWINNAGIDQEDQLFFNHTNEGMKKVFEVNIFGVLFGTKSAYLAMEKQGWGHIFNMEGFGSDGRKMSKLSLYGGSKISVRYLTQSMAKEIEGSSIGISALSPGMVMTDFLLESVKEDNEESARRKKFYNILADSVEDVTTYLGSRILTHTKNNGRIMWLTTPKVAWRFLTAPFNKRDFFKK